MSHKQVLKEAIHDTATQPPRIAVKFSVDLPLPDQAWRYSEKLFTKAFYLESLEEADTHIGCASMRGIHDISTEHPKPTP